MRGAKKGIVWMAVTADELEMPICVESSRVELANKLGIDPAMVTYLANNKRVCKSTFLGINYKIERVVE